MRTRHSKHSASTIVVWGVLIPLMLWQCDRQEVIVGTYHAVEANPQELAMATLELQPNGKGIWSIETDNASFRWNRRDNTLLLHTQAGGIIEGTIDGQTLRVEIPGTGVIVFKRRP